MRLAKPARRAQKPAMAKKTDDISALSFEKALAELEDIVKRLEEGKVELEESISLYERGAALRAHCEGKLEGAREKIEKIVADGGRVRTETATFD